MMRMIMLLIRNIKYPVVGSIEDISEALQHIPRVCFER